MTPHTPDLHTYLGTYFERRGWRLSGRRLERLQALESALHECIETACDDLIGPAELLLVDLERRIDPGCALARLSSPALLPKVLRRFLGWIPQDPVDRRLQLSVLTDLVDLAMKDRSLGRGSDRLAYFSEVADLHSEVTRERQSFERERRMASLKRAGVTPLTHEAG